MASSDQIASPGVYVSDDVGLEVTDGSYVRATLGLLADGAYGLQVTSADGSTVIVDGTSDMFKIAASGTLSTAAILSGNTASATVTIATGMTSIPAHMIYINWNGNTGELTPAAWVEPASGTWHVWFFGTTQVTGGDQTLVTVSTVSFDRAFGVLPYRYFVLEEVAF